MSGQLSNISANIPFTLTVLVQDGLTTEATFTDWFQQVVAPSLLNAKTSSSKTSVDGLKNSGSKLLTITGELGLSSTRSEEPLMPVSNTRRSRLRG